MGSVICFLFILEQLNCGKSVPCLIYSFKIILSPSIDATKSKCLARFVNDESRFSPACTAKVELLKVGKKMELCLFATRDINPGEELAYDYGDHGNLWWRAKVINMILFYFKI